MPLIGSIVDPVSKTVWVLPAMSLNNTRIVRVRVWSLPTMRSEPGSSTTRAVTSPRLRSGFKSVTRAPISLAPGRASSSPPSPALSTSSVGPAGMVITAMPSPNTGPRRVTRIRMLRIGRVFCAGQRRIPRLAIGSTWRFRRLALSAEPPPRRSLRDPGSLRRRRRPEARCSGWVESSPGDCLGTAPMLPGGSRRSGSSTASG